MKTKTLVVFPLAVLLLLGCNSFNRFTFTNVEYRSSFNAQVEPSHSNAVTSEVAAGPLMCPPFVFPDLPPVPELPIQQISSLSPSNVKELDAIQQKHIEDLRHYITTTRKLISFAHTKYIEDCQSAAKSAVSK